MPVRLRRNANMSMVVTIMSETTAMAKPVETSHYIVIGEFEFHSP